MEVPNVDNFRGLDLTDMDMDTVKNGVRKYKLNYQLFLLGLLSNEICS